MRSVLRWLLFPLGLALFLTAFVSQEGMVLSGQLQPTITPTFDFDRLAEPTLPIEPAQADLGAQDYWLNCMACHGDQGQGLTQEFRMLYPPEDQNCWTSGCHGTRPYENGFTLPTAVPVVVGAGDFNKFGNAAGLHAFLSQTMPWHKPGSLNEETYWRLTAFLLRENGFENSYTELGPDNAQFISLGGVGTVMPASPEAPISTLQPSNFSGTSGLGHLPTDQRENLLIVVTLGVLFALGAGIYFWRRKL